MVCSPFWESLVLGAFCATKTKNSFPPFNSLSYQNVAQWFCFFPRFLFFVFWQIECRKWRNLGKRLLSHFKICPLKKTSKPNSNSIPVEYRDRFVIQSDFAERVSIELLPVVTLWRKVNRLKVWYQKEKHWLVKQNDVQYTTTWQRNLFIFT